MWKKISLFLLLVSSLVYSQDILVDKKKLLDLRNLSMSLLKESKNLSLELAMLKQTSLGLEEDLQVQQTRLLKVLANYDILKSELTLTDSLLEQSVRDLDEVKTMLTESQAQLQTSQLALTDYSKKTKREILKWKVIGFISATIAVFVIVR